MIDIPLPKDSQGISYDVIDVVKKIRGLSQEDLEYFVHYFMVFANKIENERNREIEKIKLEIQNG